MSSIVNTALSAITTNATDIYLYYQKGSEIIEAYWNGTKWNVKNSTVANDGYAHGAAMAAYYVERDSDHNMNKTIHVLYMKSDQTLIERVRLLSQNVWSSVNSAPGKKPDKNSRIAGGSFNGSSNWNPTGSQWAYFNTTEATVTKFTEIRRTPKSPWYTQAVLSQSSLALGGTDIACTIAQGAIDIYYQDHAKNIKHWTNRKNIWTDGGTVVQSTNAQISTPLAAVNDGSKIHVLYADQNKKIQDYYGGNTYEVGAYYPGTYLAALHVNGKPTVFYKSLNPVGEIRTKIYEDGRWKDGVAVIPA